tara:strand:- start:90 stop:557 length:468 start_codon:yes stop_codon:yes gene_type:complete
MTRTAVTATQERPNDSINPSYLAECRALRKLHRDFDEMPAEHRAAVHHEFMWTLEALRSAGFKLEYPEDAQAVPSSSEEKERKTDSLDGLYVCPLNKAYEGPYSTEEAFKAAAGHAYVREEEADRIRAEIAANKPGPWHFVYGFKSVTIQREKPQ